MRIIHDFTYDSWLKTLRYWDMSWEQYTRYFDDPEKVIEEVLTECQEYPDISSEDLSLFITTCLSEVTGATVAPPPTDETPMKPELHIPMGYLMWVLHQQYSEIMAMPARLVFIFLWDLDIFTGNEKYDPDRRSKSVDRDGLKKVFGKTSGSVK